VKFLDPFIKIVGEHCDERHRYPSVNDYGEVYFAE